MIKDPRYWRRELTKTADQLERRQRQIRWNEISFSRTEQAVIIAFYGIRKMLQTGRCSPKVDSATVRIIEYPRRPNCTTKVIAPVLQAYFDLDHPKERNRPLLFVCHQVVHSHIFAVAVGYASGFEGIYVASDRYYNERVFFISAQTLIKVFRNVGTDPDAEFCPWMEERLTSHRVQTAFRKPPHRLNAPCSKPLTASDDG